MRPKSLDDFLGQAHLLGQGKLLANILRTKNLPSCILWGPPGCGKTTLANLLAAHIGAESVTLSAVMSGVKDIREQVVAAQNRRQMFNQQTVLFVDEIHRFNKAQQDALLPHVENGTFTLIGATTENPGFEINSALLSRCKVLVLEALDDRSIERLIQTALSNTEYGLGPLNITLTSDAMEALLSAASGDARTALNILELAATTRPHPQPDHDSSAQITHTDIEEAVQRRVVLYDKNGDQHYQTISAFIKSMRGSDPDAALHYMVRMLEGGEDPLFILRRMVIFASEDIGNADPRALQVALNATESFRFIGLPEGVLPMTQAALYLACAPKSNAVLASYGKARRDIRHHGHLPVPKHIINAPTKFAKELGHGRGYKYPHNFSGNYVYGETYLPDKLSTQRYYEPADSGEEATIKARLEKWRQSHSTE